MTPTAGITYNSQHSYTDKGWYLTGAAPSSPTPKRVLVTVPYRDHAIDFSRALDGKTHFESRELTYQFARQFRNDYQRELAVDDFTTWLWSIQGAWLHDDTLGAHGYWYDVCVTAVEVTTNPLGQLVTVDVTATAFPYRAASNDAPPDNLLSGWVL